MSEGTCDQLYSRCASRDRAARQGHEPMPVILDDLLVTSTTNAPARCCDPRDSARARRCSSSPPPAPGRAREGRAARRRGAYTSSRALLHRRAWRPALKPDPQSQGCPRLTTGTDRSSNASGCGLRSWRGARYSAICASAGHWTADLPPTCRSVAASVAASRRTRGRAARGLFERVESQLQSVPPLPEGRSASPNRASRTVMLVVQTDSDG